MLLPAFNKLIRDLDKDPEQYFGKYKKVYENSEFYENFVKNLEKLIIVLKEIKTEETKEHQELYDEQQKR